MQSMSTRIVSHFTTQLHDRVTRFAEKLENTIVPKFAERAQNAAGTRWDNPAQIPEIEATFNRYRLANIPSARSMYLRDASAVRQFGRADPLEVLQQCVEKLFTVDNLPHSYHPLFRISLEQSYLWAGDIVAHWSDLRGAPERTRVVKSRADQFLAAALEMPGVEDRVRILELHARFIEALHHPAPVAAVIGEEKLTLPRLLLDEVGDFVRQTRFIFGFGDERLLLSRRSQGRTVPLEPGK